MAVRKDEYQLDIQFITDENRAFAKTIQANKGFIKDLKSAQKEGKGVASVMNQIADNGKKVEGLDLKKVAPAQLIARARQLRQILQQIPESAPGYAKLSGELGQINNRLAQIRQSTKGVVQGGRGINSFFGGLSNRFNAVVAAGDALIGVFRGLGSAVKRASDFEQLNIALETFLGDAEKAKEVVEDLTEFSVKTPFEPDQVNRAGKALLAFGFEAETLIPTLTKIGDIAAGTGKDFNELTLIFGKARAQGRIQGEELNQLAEAGIPIYEELGKVLGVNASQIRKLGEQGKIQFEDLESVFANLTAEGGRFNGLLEKQSQSLGGLASTARGALGALSRNIGEAFVPLLKTILPPLINLLNRVVERVQPLAAAFGQRLVQAFNFLSRAFSPLIQGVKDLIASFQDAAQGSSLFSEVVNAIGAALSFVSNVIGLILSALSQYIGGITAAKEGTIGFSDVIGFLLRLFTQVVAVLNGVVSATRVAFDQVGALGDVVSNSIGLAFDRVKGFFVDNEKEVAARQAKLETAYRKLGGGIGDAFLQGYNDALGNDLPGAESKTTTSNRAVGGNRDVATRSIGLTSKDVKKLLDDRLKAIAEGIKQEELLQERALLKNEITQAEYGRNLLELKKKEYAQRIAAFEEFNAGQSAAAETNRNDLLRLEQRGSAQVVEALPSGIEGAPVERRGINAGLDEVASEEARAAARLQESLNAQLINIDQFELGRLELKRQALDAEQELLRTGTEEEIRLAAEKRDQIAEIDQQIFDKKQDLAARKQQLEEEVQDTLRGVQEDSVNFLIGLLGKDEEARKKNANAIKTFEIGNAIVAGLSEISQIRLAAQKEAASVAAIPGAAALVNLKAVGKAIAAGVRTAAAVSQIRSAKFERGGLAKSGFFGGRSHASGGVKGYFDDGTQIEVEKDEAFAIVNKRSSGLLRQLSGINVAGGGVPFFAGGGLLAPSTTPVAGVGAGSESDSQLLAQLQQLNGNFMAFPTRIKADVFYTDIEDAGNDLNTVRSAAEV